MKAQIIIGPSPERKSVCRPTAPGFLLGILVVATIGGSAMRLRKSRNDRIISGVCGGLAEGLGINSIWVRLLFVFGGGVLVWIYLILLFLMPND